MAGTYIPERSAFAAIRSRSSGSRILLFSLECALGILAVILVAAFAYWSGWLLPVAVLLYLLIVVPTALLCGFWQAVVVSLSTVLVHGFFNARQPQLSALLYPAEDPANSVTLFVFVLVALVVSRLSARVTGNARRA